MPEISRFLGIVVGMFFNEHGVPHFHAVYGDHKITIEIETARINGSFRPVRNGWYLNGWTFTGKNCSTTGAVRESINPCNGSRRWSRPMNYDVIEARYVSGFVVWLKFRDGTAGEIDLAPELTGPVFEPLHEVAVFRQFQIHPEFHTLVWPNGADFAPEFLHDNVRVTA